MVAYLESYAETFQFPIELNSEVKQLERGDGRFRLQLEERAITADQVVVATGPFQAPYVPKLADKLADDVFQTHAVGYRRPDDVPQGPYLPHEEAARAAAMVATTFREVLAPDAASLPGVEPG